MTDTVSRPATPAADVSANPHHARRWLILVILGLAQLMVALDATVVNIALPTAQHDLGFSDGARQWIVTAYALAFGSLLLIGGRLSDLFGRKWTFLVGLLGFALASAIGGAAVNFGMLVTARAVQGGFAALLAPAGLSLLTTTFTEAKERGKAFGIYGAIAGGGASLGLILGGFLTEYASWRWTMFVNLIFAGITVVGGFLLLHHSKSENRPKLDLPGTLVVSGGLFSLVYGFSHAESAGWGDSLTITFLVVAAVLLAVFTVLQARVANPLLPLRIILDRNRGGAFLAMFAAAAGMFGIFLFLTYYLQLILGYSALMTGVAFLPMTGTLVLTAAVASAALAPRVSPRLMIPAGMLTSALGMVLLTQIGLDTSYATHVLPGTLLLGVGLGLVFAPAFSIATLGVRPEDSGVASAAVNTMQQVGGSIGTALLNTLAATAAAGYVTSHLGHTSQSLLQAGAQLHSFTVTFWVSAAVFAVGGILVAAILRPGVPEFGELDGALVVA
jgi:EmrB/QacA subfamily drug resistance transporter